MKRSTLVALAVFAGLALLYGATREKTVAVGVQKLGVSPVPADAVTRIAISGAPGTLLEKSASGWTVADPAKPDRRFAADENQVNAALKAIAEFRAADFVTERSEKLAEFELDDAKAITLTVAGAAGQKLELAFGKSAKSGGSYVRKPGSNAVFTTTSPIGYQLKKTVTNWRKKAVATAPQGEIKRLSLTSPAGAPLALVRGEGDAWSLDGALPSGFRFDAAAAARWVQQFSAINAQDFAAEGDAVDFSAPTLIEASLKDGKTVKVSLGAKRENGLVPLRVDGDTQTYLLSSWQVEGLTKKLDDFRDLTLLAFDPDKVTKLEIVASGGVAPGSKDAGAAVAEGAPRRTVLVKDGATWKIVEPIKQPDGFDFDAEAVGAQLARLKSARATKLAPATADAKAGLGAATTLVELTVEGGPAQRLRFGGAASDSGEVYVKGSVDDQLYVVGASEKASWERGVELFKRQPPPDFGGMRGLDQLPPDIRRQLEAQLRQKAH